MNMLNGMNVGTRWGELVKSRRLELEMSQETLAQRCKVEQSTISRIEKGMRPRDELRWEIARALDSSVGDLFPFPLPEVAA